MKKYFTYKIAIIASIFILFLAGLLCHSFFGTDAEKLNPDHAYKDSVHHLVLKDGTKTAEKASYVLTKTEFEKEVLVKRDSIKRLKERIGSLNNLTNDLRLKLTIKGKAKLVYHDTLYIHDKDTSMGKAISYATPWLNISGIRLHDTDSIHYTELADLDIATYWKHQGFFKPSLLAVNVASSNPDLGVNGIDNYTISEPKRIYETRGFAFITGFTAGIFSRLLIPK